MSPPLFEEANRTRAFVVAILRTLATRGVASVLPDLPGQGESLVEGDVPLAQLTEAMTALEDRVRAEGRDSYVVALRAGSLVSAHDRQWWFAPMTNDEFARDSKRIARFSNTRSSDESPQKQIGLNMASTRTLRLSSDPRPADRKVEGIPLWHRSEPTTDPHLAAVLAGDIAGWTATCAR
jgi:hypothetical protein